MGGWPRGGMTLGGASLGVPFFKGLRLLRDAGLSPQGTRGVPINRGKARRYTVVSGRGGEAASPREARYAGSY